MYFYLRGCVSSHFWALDSSVGRFDWTVRFLVIFHIGYYIHLAQVPYFVGRGLMQAIWLHGTCSSCGHGIWVTRGHQCCGPLVKVIYMPCVLFYHMLYPSVTGWTCSWLMDPLSPNLCGIHFTETCHIIICHIGYVLHTLFITWKTFTWHFMLYFYVMYMSP